MTDQQKAEVRRMLGRSLRALGDTKASIEQFQAAIALDPGIESQCDLGAAVLEREGHAAAAAIFQKVVSRFGDTAAVQEIRTTHVARLCYCIAFRNLASESALQYRQSNCKNTEV